VESATRFDIGGYIAIPVEDVTDGGSIFLGHDEHAERIVSLGEIGDE
jgi:hypothetical protein